MKDYTFFAGTKYSDKNFILGYEIIEDKIIVKLTSGEKYSIPYNEENENIILERMEIQAENSILTDWKKTINRRISYSSCTIYAMALFIAINIFSLASGVSTTPWINWLAVGTCSLSTITSVPTIILGIKTRKDIEKNELFLKERGTINKNIRNENIKKNVSKKTALLIDSIPESKPVFNINSIDYMSLSELIKISESIHQYLSFGFNDEPVKEQIEEEKGISRVLRPNNK